MSIIVLPVVILITVVISAVVVYPFFNSKDDEKE